MSTSGNEKLRGEMLWVDAYLSSDAQLLPLEARGLHREMRTQAWVRGGHLPDAPEILRRLTGATLEEWARSWPLVEPLWERDEGGRLFCREALESLEDARRRKRRRSESARRAARKRWGRDANGDAHGGANGHADGDASAVREHCPQTQTQTQSQTPTQEKDDGDARAGLREALPRLKGDDLARAEDLLRAERWTERQRGFAAKLAERAEPGALFRNPGGPDPDLMAAF
jgi:uncharacterized protein YdaU (DUF1376 family)